MTEYKEAINLIRNAKISVIDTEIIPLNMCINRVLAIDILAIEDTPNFNTSSMDGYAFCFDDIKILIDNGLDILHTNKAGDKKTYSITKGGCIKTFTGSRIPNNADTLIKLQEIIFKSME